MVNRALTDEMLMASLSRALLAQPFPMRRDLEIAGATERNSLSFFDHHWIGEGMLAVAAVAMPRRSVEAALEAVALRQLLRSLLALAADAPLALAELRARRDLAGVDIALLVLDARSGSFTSACDGTASVAPPAGGDGCLRAGDVVRLSAGATVPPSAVAVPEEGLAVVVEAPSAPARCALWYKSPARLSGEATFSVANLQGEIPRAAERVREFLATRQIRQEVVDAIDIALDEILTNVVSYGFEDGHAHEILLSLTLRPGRLVMEVQDDGRPFDPSAIPAPDLDADLEERQIGGLGIHFVRTLLDSMSYSRRNGWNVLRLEKSLQPEGVTEP